MNDQSLSIILAASDSPEQLKITIDELFRQSLPPQEIVIVNPANIASMTTAINGIATTDNRIHAIASHPEGPAHTYTDAIRNATGTLVVLLAGGTLLAPCFLEKSARMLAEHPQAGLCCSDPTTVDSTGAVIEQRNLWSAASQYLSPHDLADLLRRGGSINSYGTVFRKSAITADNTFRPELEWHAAWFATNCIAFRQGICYIPEPLATLPAADRSWEEAGKNSHTLNISVLKNLLAIIRKPEYQDLLPFLALSATLSSLAPDIAEAAITSPELWDSTTYMLLQHAITEFQRDTTFSRERQQQASETAVRNDRVGMTLVQGNCALVQGQWLEAAEIFLDFLCQNPNDPDAEGAAQAFADKLSAVIGNNPAANVPVGAWLAWGRLTLSLNNLHEAFAAFKIALQLSPETAEKIHPMLPDKAEVWATWGKYAQLHQLFTEAQFALQRARELDPQQIP